MEINLLPRLVIGIMVKSCARVIPHVYVLYKSLFYICVGYRSFQIDISTYVYLICWTQADPILLWYNDWFIPLAPLLT